MRAHSMALGLLAVLVGCTPEGGGGILGGGGGGGNPGDVDTDGDGLTDEEEAALGTDPALADSDGDGILDGDEAAVGTNPMNADSDADGYSDGDEVDGNTDPLLADDHPYAGGWAIGACRDNVVASGNGVGQVTSDFELVDQHGEMVRLHDFCDREVLLVGAAFW